VCRSSVRPISQACSTAQGTMKEHLFFRLRCSLFNNSIRRLHYPYRETIVQTGNILFLDETSFIRWSTHNVENNVYKTFLNKSSIRGFATGETLMLNRNVGFDYCCGDIILKFLTFYPGGCYNLFILSH
jgi:hypothetical protein